MNKKCLKKIVVNDTRGTVHKRRHDLRKERAKDFGTIVGPKRIVIQNISHKAERKLWVK